MNKHMSLGFLIAGVTLMAYGLTASGSIRSDVSRFFIGMPTHMTFWLLAGGLAVSAVGLSGIIWRGKSN